MRTDGTAKGLVSLAVLAGLGLLVAGAALAPDTLATWLLISAGIVIVVALNGYRASARRMLDPRRSDERRGARR